MKRIVPWAHFSPRTDPSCLPTCSHKTKLYIREGEKDGEKEEIEGEKEGKKEERGGEKEERKKGKVEHTKREKELEK